MPSEQRVGGALPLVSAMTFQRDPLWRRIQSGPLKV